MYSTLCHLARAHFGGPLNGKFLLTPPLTEGGEIVILAASIAGAASLTLEHNPDAVRFAVRNGIVDFAVTQLDEALRILKNEIRKRQPVGVCLEWTAAPALAQMVERGAQPDVVMWTREGSPAIRTLLERGAILLSGKTNPVVPAGKQCVQWSLAGNPGALRRADAMAMEILPEADWERQHWLQRAPQYLPRALRHRRMVAMTSEEFARFRTLLRRRIDDGELPANLKVESEDAATPLTPEE